MTTAPEPYLLACLEVLHQATLQARLLGALGRERGITPNDSARLDDLMDAVHNLPRLLTRWEFVDEQRIRNYLVVYDDKWATASLRLLEVYERELAAAQTEPQEQRPPSWKALQARLLAEGWVPHEENGTVGVRSPHDAIFVVPEQLTEARFAGFVESLARHVATATEKFGEDPDPEILGPLRDLQGVLALITGNGGNDEGGSDMEYFELVDEELLDRRLLEVFYGKAAGEDEFDEQVVERVLSQSKIHQATAAGGIDWMKARISALTDQEKDDIRRRIKLRLTGVLHRL